MANITDIERLNYYEGEFLGATDFQAEQDYLRDMRRRHNIGQHTWGIVSGLDLLQLPKGVNTVNGPPAVDVYVQPGMAVDAFGREIVVLSKTQLTPDLFAPYFDAGNAGPQTMYVWISYAQVMLRPPTDACTLQNQPNAFGRVQEAFALTVTKDQSGPTNDLIMVDGTLLAPPIPPGSSPPPPPPQPGDIVLPADESVPYQEFSTDDSSVNWYILIGQVAWDPNTGLIEQRGDDFSALGREFAGNVTAAIFSPDDSLAIRDRFAPYPLPKDPADPAAGQFYGGVSVKLAGSLSVDRLLEATQNILVDGAADPANPKLSPLTINANGANQSLIQFRDSSALPKWSIWNQPAGANPAGLNLGEADNSGKPALSALLIQKGGNVGIGVPNPQQNLSVNGGLNIDQANGNSGSINPGLTFGSASGEGIASNQSGGGTNADGLDFYTSGTARLSITRVGNVGVGTPLPQQNLSVNAGLNIDQANGNSGTLSPGLTFGSTSGEGIASNRTAGLNLVGLDLFTRFSPRLSITNLGNVGIGTQAPAALLDVNGDARVGGSLKVQGNQNIFGVRTFLLARSNQSTGDGFRTWNVFYTNQFEQVYAVFAVFQGFSVFNNDNNLAFNSTGHVPGIKFIPQHAFVRVDSFDINSANGVCYCSESDSSEQADNSIFFTIVVLGKPKF
jgi:hypothetical protein